MLEEIFLEKKDVGRLYLVLRAIAEIKQSDTEAWVRCARMLSGYSSQFQNTEWKGV